MLVILSDPSRWDEAELLRHTREHFTYDRTRSSWIAIRSTSGKRHGRHETRFVIERPSRRRSSFFGL